GKKDIKQGAFHNDNTEIEIFDPEGKESITVPVKGLEAYIHTPKKALQGIAKIIESERKFSYRYNAENENLSIDVDESERSYFYFSDDEELLFPELVHGMATQLEGKITRLNDRTSTLGLEYQGHVLTIKPEASITLNQLKD